MLTSKNALPLTLVVLLALMLSACVMGEPMAASCDAEISYDLALEAQNALMAGMSTGSVTLSDSHLSSLLTELTKANFGDAWITSIHTCFVEDQMMVSFGLNPAYGLEDLSAVGALSVEDHMVSVDLDELSAGTMVVDPSISDLIGDRLTAALNDPRLGTVLNLEMAEGELTLMIEQ